MDIIKQNFSSWLVRTLGLSVAFAIFLQVVLIEQAKAQSLPVRLAITAVSGNGIEQDIADYISAQFSQDPNVVISTVNPDWYVQCKINDNENRFTGQIRYNGTVTVKTLDGQIIANLSSQSYNQDFSPQLGSAYNWQGAPLNKQLVQSAARDVVNDLGEKAAAKIKEAVPVEMQSREYNSEAKALANNDKYEEAINVLKKIGPDSVHFQSSKKVIDQYAMEKQSLELIHNAEAKAKKGNYSQSIDLLKEVDTRSKRHKLALQLIDRYKHILVLAHQHTKKSDKSQ